MHVHPMPHSVAESERDPIYTFLCNYSPAHKYTTLPPNVMMIIQVYSGVFKAVLYIDERAYERFCNKFWHRMAHKILNKGGEHESKSKGV